MEYQLLAQEEAAGLEDGARPLELIEDLARRPADHQPNWGKHRELAETRRRLLETAPLVSPPDIRELRERLAAAAAGEVVVLQAGDCAESFHECGTEQVNAKLANLDRLSAQFSFVTGQDVVAVGRIGGQFGKPRSRPTELHGDVEIPSFLGHVVNSEIPDALERRPDPTRMLEAHRLSEAVLGAVDRHRTGEVAMVRDHHRFGPWASHEALLMDYELPQLRRVAGESGIVLGSTHLPWVGERTRRIDGAHVAMLSAIDNPVGCKVGPAAEAQEVVRLCAALDPMRTAGRLVLIVRMGIDNIGTRFRAIAEAVRDAGHRPVWLCDPMHGNTTTTSTGAKTRYLEDIVGEIRVFRTVCAQVGVPAGGVHLETSAIEVTECLGGAVRDPALLSLRYTSLCDPRLSPGQALEAINAWDG